MRSYALLSMSKSFGQSFRIDKSHGMLAMKVFCSWDFKVIKKSSVALMSENISTQLKVWAERRHTTPNTQHTHRHTLLRNALRSGMCC